MSGGNKEKKTVGIIEGAKLEVYRQMYPPPTPEPELDSFRRLVRRKGSKYSMPTRITKDGKGRSYKEVSQKEFNRLICDMDIRILTKRKRPYEIAIKRYQTEIRKVHTRNASSLRRAEVRDTDRELLEKRIETMLHNWEFEFRNKRSSKSAKRRKEKIRVLQRKLNQMKPEGIDETLTNTFIKYYFDPDELDRVANGYAKPRAKLGKMEEKTKQWTGDGEDLIDFYKAEIDFLEDSRLEELDLRIKINQAYSAGL